MASQHSWVPVPALVEGEWGLVGGSREREGDKSLALAQFPFRYLKGSQSLCLRNIEPVHSNTCQYLLLQQSGPVRVLVPGCVSITTQRFILPSVGGESPQGIGW